ncbi:MAG: peptidoglycan recognition family protein [Patescibacteria group bacterium]
MTPKNIIVHHTASARDTTTVKAVDRYHRDKDWGGGAHIAKSTKGWYVAYHYFIEATGVVTQCADDTEIRWHAAERNIDSLGICLAGWFDDGHDDVPTPAQVKSLTELLKFKSKQHNIPAERIYPHRKFANKTCYGLHMGDAWAANLIRTRYNQITDPKFLAKYKADQILKLPNGKIVLKAGVVPIPGTTKVIYQ